LRTSPNNVGTALWNATGAVEVQRDGSRLSVTHQAVRRCREPESRLLLHPAQACAGEFELEVYGITGNESRVKPELGWSDELATDSYDLMIYAILRRGFEGVDGIAFCGFQANELLFEVMGRTFLCLHGHQVGANLQKSVQEITGKYAARGITVDYTLFGHLHATAIGDYHARNASLVGSNAYSEAGLNFCSKAAQNVHIVTAQGLDGMKVDLQDTTGIEPYPFASEWEAYCPKSAGKLHEGAVVYQVIV